MKGINMFKIKKISKQEKIAERIVSELFTNSMGKKVKRLVLELEDGFDGSGWGKTSIKNIIIKHLV